MKKANPKLSLTDILAIDRTRLANERTFLGYFRTFIVIFSSGAAIVKLDFLDELQSLGVFFMFAGPVLLLVGIARFFYVKRHIKKLYNM